MTPPVDKVTNDIAVYCCPLVDDGLSVTDRAKLSLWLPEGELAKVRRYARQEAQEKGLLVRGYLRALLTRYAMTLGVEITPSQWRFDYGDKGKPRLQADLFQRTQIAFNISHSGDYLLLAITHGDADIELGADIERRRSTTNIYSILNHYFTEQERDGLLALPTAEQRERFFNLWALKESYIKAKGLGLALSLKSFGFSFDDVSRQCLLIDGLGKIEASRGISLMQYRDSAERSDDWSVTLAHLDEYYRFAVCINRPTQCLRGTMISLSELFKSV
ncbi:hypothetical protein BEL05_02415 [Shewanella colwelliana]|uniref:Uncharacterized protein n=1 Tax=Shewanella colwelliana TaxID=23 RepID=A0A1E5IX26_SHECO|nr:4'-phosphopantetheinyl transferase superfamily protein [Shewanella colwelliana]OEG75132.1 hypothetical protein BEL05_02415 [Shewanella colwelliana]